VRRHQNLDSPFVSRRAGTLTPTVELRRLNGFVVPYACGRPMPGIERQPSRQLVDLAGEWRAERVTVDHQLSLTNRRVSLSAIEEEGRGRHLVDHDDSGWRTHRVPLPENVNERYEDGVWYRRVVRTAAPGREERIRLTFLAVNYIADVWLNGRWIGCHEGGYSPFSLDVTHAVVDGDNLIAVRVDNPPWDSRTDIVPAVVSDWWNYTGVIQDVYLERLPAVSVARVDVVPTAVIGDPPGRAEFVVTVVVDRPDEAAGPGPVVRARLAEAVVPRRLLGTSAPADLEGAPASWQGEGPHEVVIDPETGDGAVRFAGVVDQPRWWTPQTPNLYVLTVELIDRGRIVDSFATQIGLRTVAVAADSPAVLLNGRRVAFHGVARHEDWADTGRTVASPERVVEDLIDIRTTGATLLRTAHYPNHPLTYLVADRVGLAVVEEIPTWWFDTYHFADQLHRGIGEQMWREMVFRDYNRPSVLFWSATNEAISVEHRAEFLRRVVHDLRRYDDGRLVTQAAAADRPGPHDPTQSLVDVAGWTTYFGVFGCTAAGSEADLTERFLDRAHAAWPDKPLLVAEFGMWAREDDALVDRQRQVFDHTWPVHERRFTTRPDGWLIGSIWWAAYDWRTPIAGLNTFGLSDICRQRRRPVRDALESRYQTAPLADNGPSHSARPRSLPQFELVHRGVPEDPRILADFTCPDGAYPMRNAVVDRLVMPCSGRPAVRMTALGSWPGIGIYLYRHPVDLREATHLCVRVLASAGGYHVRLGVRDVNRTEADVLVPDPVPGNRWTTVCVRPSRFAGVDLGRVERVHFTMAISDDCVALGQRFYVDSVTA